MSLVLALFDDPAALERAIDRLDDAGLGDDVVDVEDQSNAAGAGATPSPAGIGMPGSRPAIGGQRAAAVPLDLNLFEPYLSRVGEAGEFFREAVQDGGKLLVLETRRADEAERVLREAGAGRVHAS